MVVELSFPLVSVSYAIVNINILIGLRLMEASLMHNECLKERLDSKPIRVEQVRVPIQHLTHDQNRL